MSITLFLVTKGRKEYLKPLLNSLEGVLEVDGVKLMVILNGTSKGVTQRYEEFERLHSQKVVLHYLPKNDARPSVFWPFVKEIDSEWVAFPSDDDILEEKFFKNFKTFSSKYGEYGAVATSLAIVNSTGKSNGGVRKPYIDSSWTPVAQVAHGFHQCPFLWPGLVVRLTSLPALVPNSRYATDWWVGLYLLLTAKVATSSEVMVHYRVHDEQESNLAPLNRKNFEALQHLGSLVDSRFFAEWISSLDEDQVNEFVNVLKFFPPIYGDPTFSPTIVNRISTVIQKSTTSPIIEASLISLQSQLFNVLLGYDQSKFLSIRESELVVSPNPNFEIRVEATSCKDLLQFAKSYQQHSDWLTVNIFCKHATNHSARDAIKVDCTPGEDELLDSDSIITQIQEALEIKGLANPTVTPREFRIVIGMRKMKKFLPASFLNTLKKSF